MRGFAVLRHRPVLLAALLSAVAFVGMPAMAHASDTLDQSQTDFGTGALEISGPNDQPSAPGAQSLAQTFTAGLTGGLDRVDLYLGRDGPAAPLTVEIRNASSDGPGSTVLASASVPSASVPPANFQADQLGGWVEVDFASPAPVTAGTQYAIVAYTGDAGATAVYYWSMNGQDNLYADGADWQSHASPPDTWYMGTYIDQAFRTYVEVPDTDLSIATSPAITTGATSANGAPVSYTAPAASDPDDGSAPSVSCLPASGSTFPVGSTTVTCTANDSDDSPSQARSTFVVTVTDSDLALHSVPADITTPATSASGTRVSYTPPTATDEGGQTPPVNCSPAAGSVFPVGTTTVTCRASATDGDDSNSPVSATFKVTVARASTSLSAAPQLVTFPPPTPAGLGRVAATLSAGGVPLADKTISFTVGTTPLCAALTSAGGKAGCTLNPLEELQVILAGGYQASFAGTAAFAPSTASTPWLELGNGLAQLTSGHSHQQSKLTGSLTRGGAVYATLSSQTSHDGAPLLIDQHRRLTTGRYTLTVTLPDGRQLKRTITIPSRRATGPSG